MAPDELEQDARPFGEPLASAPAYEVTEDCIVTTHNPYGGDVVEQHFHKGKRSPKNEYEELALEAAVIAGHAKRPRTPREIKPEAPPAEAPPAEEPSP